MLICTAAAPPPPPPPPPPFRQPPPPPQQNGHRRVSFRFMEKQEIAAAESLPLIEEEIMPIVSPDELGFEEADVRSTAIPPASSETVILTDDLREKIIRQVEYYFSDENLSSDKFLMNYVKKDKEGFVPLALIASFRKMKKLIQDSSLIAAALKESSQLIVSSDGKKVKRAHPLPNEIKDRKFRTVLVENLPEDNSMENIQKIFCDAGNIKNICIHDPHAREESRKVKKAEKVVSAKLHALVEYETVEAAEKAVATLNDEEDWRSGMRVKLLVKQMGKYGMSRKVWKGVAAEKDSDIPASDTTGGEQSLSSNENHSEATELEEGAHALNERIGRKGRSRGRSWVQKQHSINGQGHGTVSSSHAFEGSKPPPGPKMPDGTRGFTMGRGRPPVVGQN